EVDGDKPIEDVHVEGHDVCVDGVEGGVGRVVVQHVQAAERPDCGLDHADDALLLRDVNLDGYRRIEVARNPLGLRSIEIGDDYRRSLACHQARRRLADTAARARDNRDLAIEPSHPSSMSALGRRAAQGTFANTRPALGPVPPRWRSALSLSASDSEAEDRAGEAE